MARDALKTLAGREMIIVRAWHMSVFVFLIAFVVLFVFFYTFQPHTLLGNNDWLFYNGSGAGVERTNTDSENDASNRWLSSRGREIVFAWAIGLGALVGLIVHFLIIYL